MGVARTRRQRAALAATLTILGLALVPMLLATIGFVGSIGMSCTPMHVHSAAEELGGAAMVWAMFLTPAAPSLLLVVLGSPGVARMIASVVLAVFSGVLSVALLAMSAMAHLC